MREDWNRELGEILESLSYELTAARSAGLGRSDALRAALRRARQLVDEADALAAGVQAEDRDASD